MLESRAIGCRELLLSRLTRAETSRSIGKQASCRFFVRIALDICLFVFKFYSCADTESAGPPSAGLVFQEVQVARVRVRDEYAQESPDQFNGSL